MQLNPLQKRRRADPAYRLRDQIHSNLYAARRRQRLGQFDNGRPISKHSFSRTTLAAHFAALGQDICDPTLELDHIRPLSDFPLDQLGPDSFANSLGNLQLISKQAHAEKTHREKLTWDLSPHTQYPPPPPERPPTPMVEEPSSYVNQLSHEYALQWDLNEL